MIDLAINAIFTGIGTAIGLTIFEYYIKPHILKIRRHTSRIKKHVRGLMK